MVIGNYMNGTGFRGSARAIKINSINKLTDTKASDNKTTLLHFIAEVVERQFPDLVRFLDELQPLTSACRVSFADLNSEHSDIKNRLEELRVELDNYYNDPESLDPDDKFLRVCREFVDRNSPRFEETDRRFDQMKKIYEEVVTMFGEDPRASQPEDFFGIFKTFMTSFDKVMKDNQKVREVEMKKMERKAREERERQLREERLRKKQEAMQVRKHSVMVSSNQPEEDKGMMDKLLDQLRTGTDLDTQGKRVRGRMGAEAKERARRSAAAKRVSVSARTLDLLKQIKNPEIVEPVPALPALVEDGIEG